jgi:hypothetical protein
VRLAHAAVRADNGLSLTLFGLFVVSIAGQAIFGWRAFLAELPQHAGPPVSRLPDERALRVGRLRKPGERVSPDGGVRAAYRIPVQKGSSESKKPERKTRRTRRPGNAGGGADAPWPVHRGGLALKLYSHSLSIALVALFLLSFGLHVAGSTRRITEEASLHHQPTQSVAETLVDAEFWYGSFQN